MKLLKIGTKGSILIEQVLSFQVDNGAVTIHTVSKDKIMIPCGSPERAQEAFDNANRQLDQPHFDRVKAAIEDCVSTAVLRIQQQYPDISKENVRQIIEANVQKAMDSLGLETEYVPF